VLQLTYLVKQAQFNWLATYVQAPAKKKNDALNNASLSWK